ncbi:putative ABC transport system permease protein [Flagellimonas meridianipacifica]|uniref:Putative ABC transport system permease protein n=2 Tax=Flagellimonas meridianipacifica TaxID=1080225 RepID=A0A2T0MFM1_9FLAO|nr:putative ABC transport system permease protein [Allomuricauda pacifica]
MKTFIRTFFRYLLKNKLYTFVTIFGFSIAITFVFFLGTYLINESSVDGFHVNGDRIFRIEHEGTEFSAPIAPILSELVPEIESYTRTYDNKSIINHIGEEKFEIDLLAVDSSFFEIFSYSIIDGQNVLETKSSIVLSESLAKKMFSSRNPIGETISLDNKFQFIITGIMSDFPENTHLKKVDAIVNIGSMGEILGMQDFMENFEFCSLSIYLLEKPNSDLPSKANEILSYFKNNFWIYKDGYASTVVFTPLKEIYYSQKEGNWTKNSSKFLVYVVVLIVFLILLLSIGNYINLTIAQAFFRGKEVAIRKLVGSSKNQLFLQFLMESIFLCGAATLMSVLFTILLSPYVNDRLGLNLSLTDELNIGSILIFFTILLSITLISGIIPAIKVSGFKPLEIVRGKLRQRTKTVYTKYFIIFQFTITIGLLASCWIIINQTKYLKSKDLGFKYENLIWTDYLGNPNEKSRIKEEIMKVSGVEAISIVWGSPIDGGSNQSFTYEGRPVSFQEMRVDTAFFEVFDIPVQSNSTAFGKKGVYLNNTAIKELGIERTASNVNFDGEKVPILGLVDDFNFNRLQLGIRPLMIKQETKNSYANKVFIKLGSSKENTANTIKEIKKVYAGLTNDNPFELMFVNTTIQEWYLKEERLSKLLSYFAFLSIIISSLGILAMSTYFLKQKRKEISIRKVNGATITEILVSFNKNYVKWVFIAFLIITPIIWYLSDRWLENFAFRIKNNFSIYILSCVFTLVMALLAVSWQSLKAAKTNPVQHLHED